MAFVIPLSPFIVSEMAKYEALSLAEETFIPVEMRFWVSPRLLLMLRSVDSAFIAELLVRIEDIVYSRLFLVHHVVILTTAAFLPPVRTIN